MWSLHISVTLGSQWVGQPTTMEPIGMKRNLFLGFDIQKDKLIQGKRERFQIGNWHRLSVDQKL